MLGTKAVKRPQCWAQRHKIWLTQEADAKRVPKSWSILKHVQPKEGCNELAPREIKFRYRAAETAIRERAGSSQEGRKRAKDTPGYFLCFFFLFIIIPEKM